MSDISTMIFLTLGVTLLLSFIPEWFLKPRVAISARSSVSFVIHVLVIVLIFSVIFLLLRRPYFSGLVALGTLCVFVIVSNAKHKTLREPLVVSDIAMFSQAFKHPRLYLPFLGIVPAIGAPLMAGVFIFFVIKYEPGFKFSLWTMLVGALVIVAIGVLIKFLSLKLRLTQEPTTDIKRYGLIASLCGYAFQARTGEYKENIRRVLSSSPFSSSSLEKQSPSHLEQNHKQKPNIIVIQSESFFDARRMHSSIKLSTLKNFDRLCKESQCYGRLSVPAWGANTMRTEFSFLTAIPSRDLGLYRFYPYHYLANQTIPSLASCYREQGYHCVCVHPHPATFFGRDRVFPHMGFDEFVDIGSFDTSKTFGPYLSDAAVTQKIMDILDESAKKKRHNKPVFIFAITMENHGPLHLEKTDSNDVANVYHDTPPENHNDLTVYLRHLKNADRMFGDLHDVLKESVDESMLCVYGDHIPSMPAMYEATAYEDDRTDYFIWRNKQNKDVNPDTDTDNNAKNLEVEDLAECLLSASNNLKEITQGY